MRRDHAILRFLPPHFPVQKPKNVPILAAVIVFCIAFNLHLVKLRPVDNSSSILSFKELVMAAKELAYQPKMLPEEPVDVEAVAVAKQKIELYEQLSSYDRAQDIYLDFSPLAAKQLVFEARFGTNSSDRIKAADKILDRAEGRPVNRQVNLNATPQDFNEEELKNKTEFLLKELGYIEGGNVKKLIQDESKPRTIIPSTGRREIIKGERDPEESDA